MMFSLHPQLCINTFNVGNEQSPVLVIDNLIANPEQLIDIACAQQFTQGGVFYPGIRAVTPLEYQKFLIAAVCPLLVNFFKLPESKLGFSLCHFSLVTTPATTLNSYQRIPHVDAVDQHSLATLHYLFNKPLGGTDFYRHRATGFETVNEQRKEHYFSMLQQERAAMEQTSASYMNGDTNTFEKIGSVEGVFNRMVVYHKNLLHSGAIAENFVPDTNPRTGRLSINCFIDVKIPISES